MRDNNQQFDTLTLKQAAAHLVTAYRQAGAYLLNKLDLDARLVAQAPNSRAELDEFVEANHFLPFSYENSDTAIYGRDGNCAFRVMHDAGHLFYDYDTTTEDELNLAYCQWFDLERYLPADWIDTCRQVYLADTVGQSMYYVAHNDFPADQTAFVLGELNGVTHYSDGAAELAAMAVPVRQ